MPARPKGKPARAKLAVRDAGRYDGFMDRILAHAPPALAYAALGAAPAVALIAGAIWGGWLIWAAVIWVALASPAADTVLGRAFPDAPQGRVFVGARLGLAILGACHFALLAVTLWALVRTDMAALQRIALFLGAGMFFGQISNAAAHEMIHSNRRWLFRLGSAIYVSLLFGHHVSAHRLVHHHHVATDRDPNSARLGESFWRFFPRAWAGSFRAGLAAERALTARKKGRANPYLVWVGGGIACAVLVTAVFGARGLADYLGLCLYAQIQLMLSDYVQHYGLRRAILPDGRAEPVGPRHSWDSPHPLSSLTLVNAPRHSDHHAHPARAYPALRLNRAQSPRPLLPWPLSVMAAIALVPPLWRRVMDRRVARMMAGAADRRGAPAPDAITPG